MDLLPLDGRTALVTGVSRRRGIGFAIARKLAALGASVFIHHYRPHDEQQPWGADDLTEIKAELTASLVGDAALVTSVPTCRIRKLPPLSSGRPCG